MEPENTSKLRKLFSNKFVLGLFAGVGIGLFVKNTFVALALIVVLSLVWYGASRKKDEPIEEEV